MYCALLATKLYLQEFKSTLVKYWTSRHFIMQMAQAQG